MSILQFRERYCPVFLSCFSAILYSLQNLNVKYVGHDAGVWTITCLRGVVGVLCALIACAGSIRPKRDNVKLLICRAFFGGLTIVSAFWAVMHISLLCATVILSTSPVWTAILTFRSGLWTFTDTATTLTCIVGVYFVSSGTTSTSTLSWLGIGSAILSSLSQAVVNITIKQTSESTGLITFYGMAGSIVLALPGLIYEQLDGFRISTKVLPSICTVGLLSFSAQFAKTWSISLANGWYILVLRYLEVFFSLVWDYLIFDHLPNYQELIGGLMILLSCVICILQPRLSDDNNDDTSIV